MSDRESLFQFRCDGGCGYEAAKDSPQQQRCPSCQFGMLVLAEDGHFGECASCGCGVERVGWDDLCFACQESDRGDSQ